MPSSLRGRTPGRAPYSPSCPKATFPKFSRPTKGWGACSSPALEHALVSGWSYSRPCTACNTSSALLKVSVPAPLMRSTTSWGASLLWAVEATSSLLAGKFRFGRNYWSWPRSRLLRSPRLPRLLFFVLLCSVSSTPLVGAFLPALTGIPNKTPSPSAAKRNLEIRSGDMTVLPNGRKDRF